MKTLKEYMEMNEEVNEASLLDINDVISDTDAKVFDKYAEHLFKEYPKYEQPGMDACGRKLEPGDWVMCIPPGSKSQAVQQFGIVVKCSAKRTTISVPSKYGSWQYFYFGKGKRNKAESPFRNISLSSEYIFKIVDKDEFIKTLS